MQIVMNEFSGRLSAYLFGFGLPFEAPGLLFEFPDRHLANPIKIIKKKVSVMNNSEEKSKTSWEVIGECPECGSDVLRARYVFFCGGCNKRFDPRIGCSKRLNNEQIGRLLDKKFIRGIWRLEKLPSKDGKKSYWEASFNIEAPDDRDHEKEKLINKLYDQLIWIVDYIYNQEDMIT